VQIIQSSVTTFDRDKKRIQLIDKSWLAYDYLVLTCGVQYHARTLGSNFAKLSNVFDFNAGIMAKLSERAPAFIADENHPLAVIYGRSLQAMSAIEMLIKKGIPASQIHFVIPVAKPNRSCFKNEDVNKKVLKVLLDYGVVVQHGFKLFKWGHQDHALSAIVLKHTETDELVKVENINMFIYADEKSVNSHSFKAINDSCLVFDGRLVIDKYFRTQDPYM